MSYCIGQNKSLGHSSLCRRGEGMENWVSGHLGCTVHGSQRYGSSLFSRGVCTLPLCTDTKRCTSLLQQIFLTQTSTLYTRHTYTALISLDLTVCDTVVTLSSFHVLLSGPKALQLSTLPFFPGSFAGSFFIPPT